MIAMESMFVALSTPWGRSAIAIIRCSGFGCLSLCESIFSLKPEPRRTYAKVYRSADGLILDNVIMVYYRAPKSYTGLDMLEISSHGNPLIIQKILEDLCHRGCRLAEPGEFTKTAFFNGKMDLVQAEAVADVIHSQSESALRIANGQLTGSLGVEIAGIWEQLVRIMAQLEVAIDFSEDEPFALDEYRIMDELGAPLDRLSQLESTARYRPILQLGVRTVIIGPPNVGKSSLLNGLLGQERALVSPIAGTTRDFLEESISVGKWNLRIVDTAGLHSTANDLEQLGMRRSREKLEIADFVLLVFDGSQALPNLDHFDWETFEQKKGLILLNKRDIFTLPDWPHMPLPWEIIPISALNPKDITGLKNRICQELEAKRIVPDDLPCVVNLRQSACLREAIHGIEMAQILLQKKIIPELVAAELNLVLKSLEKILGRNANEDILNQIFSQFCIGK
ncbi:MAG: tRNA uridine-5-carboxymethylaminomethyl(34) synthesis GTPase MnmE [Puniceicoccales bacterium]|jgi:tRNA modification GTPase|nr:tRNA uridine-5-carboxymethylaminomethyl(34) synthesis GTPase MnmE [Puniceicoccales bacterium]